jgi:hypothetical protein
MVDEIQRALELQRKRDQKYGRILHLIGFKVRIDIPGTNDHQIVAVYLYRN